jgi:AcrR family transcriptional regulator
MKHQTDAEPSMTPATAPPSPPRNAEETRRRILAAALEEFADKGIDGARVDRIAERSQSNKRMLYHYFGSKEGLYRAVLQQRLADRPAPPADEVGAGERLTRVFRAMVDSPQYVRLLMWEALERGGAPEAEEIRRASLQRTIDRVRTERIGRSGADTRRDGDAKAAAEAGIDAASTLDLGVLVLAELALATFPLAFPQLTRMVTGLAPDDPQFTDSYVALLHAVGDDLDAVAP